MSKINLLDSSIFNRIAAGEVIDKPASIVKELVENSLDAKATHISIEIEEGGIKKIAITDNGSGIEKDDVKKAFLPHATSKIAKLDDLDSISSFGFRGEALASIASVTQIEMISKTENSESGTKVCLSGGKFESEEEIGCPNGTFISVKNLFFNTPARAKFMRKTKTEENEITTLVEKLIFANPNICFKYYIDGILKYNTQGNGLKNNLYVVYGEEIFNNLIQVHQKQGEYEISGYICNPLIAKNNRSYQTIFVNGRLVNNYMISTAVQNAVDNFIMKGKFPIFSLNLNLPYSEVDVNVHPSKLEVKFADNNKIFALFNNAIFNAVGQTSFIQEQSYENKQNNEIKPISDLKPLSENEGISFVNTKTTNEDKKSVLEEVVLNKKEKEETKKDELYSSLIKTLIDEPRTSDKMILRDKPNVFTEVLISADKKEESVSLEQKAEVKTFEQTFIPQNQTQERIDVLESYKNVGVVFNTYIIIEKDDSMFIIDQHAAHERQLYDKLLEGINQNNLVKQDLLVPYVLQVNNQESTFLDNNISYLNDFGFEIAPFGNNTFKVNAVPYILKDIDLKKYFDEILSNISTYMKKPLEYNLEKYKQTACKAAVKGGMKLSDNEISVLVKRLKEEKNVLLCPHGRPIIVEFKKTEVEKWFKRII